MAITGGGNLRSTPAPVQAALATNFLDFATGATDDTNWAQQFLPDLMAAEAEVFGNRTISGFLAQVGAEEAMSSDQVVWSEQGRLHLSYNGVTSGTGVTFTVDSDVDGNATTDHGIRVGDTVIVSDASASIKAFVSAVSGAACTINPFNHNTMIAGGIADNAVAGAINVLVYGSEFGKGTVNQTTANKPSHKSFSNQPIIIKDMYEVNGSDASQIGWVEVTGEDGGANGYLWYLKAEGETRMRFTDYLEMAMLEAETSAASAGTNAASITPAGSLAGAIKGSEGLFAAIEDRGNTTSGVTGVNAATDLAEFDAILAEFDRNGAIEENMMFVNRATALAMDDMLASMNSYGAGGTSYGVFDNSEDMALNLGFSGFRRGSYDFYKSDMKYLNDQGTRGGIKDTVNNIRGVVIPAGVSSVYDQQLGKNLKRPFLHVRYRASQTESRKMKTWITGSVGAVTSDLDAMTVNYLSERCLITQGANNFMLMK